MQDMSERENLEKLANQVLSRKFSQKTCKEYQDNLKAINQRSICSIGYSTQIAEEIREELGQTILKFQQCLLGSKFEEATHRIDDLLEKTTGLYCAFGGQKSEIVDRNTFDSFTQ